MGVLQEIMGRCSQLQGDVIVGVRVDLEDPRNSASRGVAYTKFSDTFFFIFSVHNKYMHIPTSRALLSLDISYRGAQ
jgi:hypothetical protein